MEEPVLPTASKEALSGSGVGITSSTSPPITSTAVPTILDNPMFRYFAVTAAFAFVALVVLAIYCAIAYIEKKQFLKQDRRQFAAVPTGYAGDKRVTKIGGAGDRDSPSRPQRYSVPFVWQFAQRN